MTQGTSGLYSGILTALAIVAAADEETLFAEIVDVCSVEELVAFAIENGETEWSGLDGYGYTKKLAGRRDRFVK